MNTTESFTSEAGKEASTKEQNKEVYSNVVKLEGYPFAAIKQGEGWVCVFGKNMITERVFLSPETMLAWLNTTEWHAILNVIGIYYDFLNDTKL